MEMVDRGKAFVHKDKLEKSLRRTKKAAKCAKLDFLPFPGKDMGNKFRWLQLSLVWLIF